MKGIKVVLPNKTEADAFVTSVSIDENQDVTVTAEKALEDDDDGDEESVGGPQTVQLNATDAAAVIAALLPVLNPLAPQIVSGKYAAANASASTSTTSTSAAATDTSSAASADAANTSSASSTSTDAKGQ